jgi:hypothetical protein
MLRLFMSLVVGVTSAAWVWSSKTLKSWQRLVQRLLGPPPRKVVDIPAAVPLKPMSRGLSHGTAHNYVITMPIQAPPSTANGTTPGKFHHKHTHHHHHHHPRLALTHHKSNHRVPKQPTGSETTV